MSKLLMKVRRERFNFALWTVALAGVIAFTVFISVSGDSLIQAGMQISFCCGFAFFYVDKWFIK